MAKLIIDGQEITLPRYNLTIMAQAAPFLDEIQEMLAGTGVESLSIVQANKLVLDTAGFLAAGTCRVNADLTQDKLAEHFTMADAQMLQGVVQEALSEIGIALQPAGAPQVDGETVAEPVAAAQPAPAAA